MLDLEHGSDSGPDYLGTGLADALITRLSAVRRFAVRPTSSVLRYGADSDPLVAGRELGVAFVLDGRIRRAQDRIRVTIQLLNVRDGTAIWAGQFDEKFTDVLSLEDSDLFARRGSNRSASDRRRTRPAGQARHEQSASSRGLSARPLLLEHVYRRRLCESHRLLSPGDCARSKLCARLRRRRGLLQLAGKFYRDAVCRVFGCGLRRSVDCGGN